MMLLSLGLAVLVSAPPDTTEATLMLSTKRARGEAYASDLVRLVAAHADLQPFAAAGVDILADFGSVVVGSENILTIASSFLVVDYALPRTRSGRTSRPRPRPETKSSRGRSTTECLRATRSRRMGATTGTTAGSCSRTARFWCSLPRVATKGS